MKAAYRFAITSERDTEPMVGDYRFVTAGLRLYNRRNASELQMLTKPVQEAWLTICGSLFGILDVYFFVLLHADGSF